MEKAKKMRKPAAAIIAAALIMAVTVVGTLAYLTANQTGNNAVTNTFIAAGGGHLIDPDPDPEIPDPPAGLQKGFYLAEHEVSYDTTKNNYKLGTALVKEGNYDKVAPEMILPKDPRLTVDIATDAVGYVFVKVTDTTKGNLMWEINTADWREVTGVTLPAGEKLYCYKNAAQTGIEGKDIASAILKEDRVVVAGTMTDVNAAEDGMQLGNLKFEAYICQAQGFENAAEAFKACF